jgi:hypothetical protein
MLEDLIYFTFLGEEDKKIVNFGTAYLSYWVQLSVRMGQLGSHWTDFHKIRYPIISLKSV